MSEPTGVFCGVCRWEGAMGAEAHVKFIHPGMTLDIVRQMDTLFILPPAERALHPVSDATPDLALYDLPALASEPVPATGNPEGIDVERLARALHACEHPAVPDCRLGLNVEPRPEWAGRRKCEVDADRIAAEYARQREGERR